MVNHFTADQQSQGVKQSVDGVPWLVDGHDYGSSLTRHPVNMNQEASTYIKNVILQQVLSRLQWKIIFKFVQYMCIFAEKISS